MLYLCGWHVDGNNKLVRSGNGKTIFFKEELKLTWDLQYAFRAYLLYIEDVKNILRFTDPYYESSLVVAQLGQRFSIPLVTAMR